MTPNPTDSDIEKERESLTSLLSKARPAVAVDQLNQKEARALLGYITYLENLYEQAKGSRAEIPRKECNQQNLDAALIKLVGISAGLHPIGRKREAK